jgi:hypothetical protein
VQAGPLLQGLSSMTYSIVQGFQIIIISLEQKSSINIAPFHAGINVLTLKMHAAVYKMTGLYLPRPFLTNSF